MRGIQDKHSSREREAAGVGNGERGDAREGIPRRRKAKPLRAGQVAVPNPAAGVEVGYRHLTALREGNTLEKAKQGLGAWAAWSSERRPGRLTHSGAGPGFLKVRGIALIRGESQRVALIRAPVRAERQPQWRRSEARLDAVRAALEELQQAANTGQAEPSIGPALVP